MATKKTKTTESAGVTLVVSAKRDGFRRCGMAFGREAVEVTVTPEQADILKAETMLIVTGDAEPSATAPEDK